MNTKPDYTNIFQLKKCVLFFRSVFMKWCQEQAFFLVLKVLDTYISDLVWVNEAYPKCHSTGEQVIVSCKIVQKESEIKFT